MADFVQTMKDWRRMCKDRSCDSCNLSGSCNLDPDSWSDYDISKIDRKVKIWVAEHPEPVYPTWEEWLQSVGVMESSEGLLRRIKGQLLIDGIPAYAIPTTKVLEPIPADLAQKLGVEPKEG